MPKVLEVAEEEMTLVTTNCGSRVNHITEDKLRQLFAELEQYGVRHEDPYMRNVTYNPWMGRFCLIDFEFATILSQPDPGPPPDPDPDPDQPSRVDEDVEVQTAGVSLAGRLTVPRAARGAVVFVHGSGSSRHSPRNRFVARVLNDAGLATLLFDLLTPEEGMVRANVFDIELLEVK